MALGMEAERLDVGVILEAEGSYAADKLLSGAL